MKYETLKTILRIALAPFIIMGLWFSLLVFKDVYKGFFEKKKKGKIGIVISK